MPSLDEIARSQTSLADADVAWLHALARDWQILADLSFADLVLWVPDSEEKGWWSAAQIRPTTGPTSMLEDIAGTFVPVGRAPAVMVEAWNSGSVAATTEPKSRMRLEAVPVRCDDRTIAIVMRRSALSVWRSMSALESAYKDAAETLIAMIVRGDFPLPGRRSELADSLRVGDGFVRTDRSGQVVYASPNALSAFRSLGLVGDLVGTHLGEIATDLVDRRPTDRGPLGLFDADDGGETDLENPDASLMARVIPLRDPKGDHAGSLVLLRDVTELRLRERELISKEATIREIHHRVKNNLQTVAALLRLQARRSGLPEAKEALEDAERRVASIALVHETLSHGFGDVVDFDEIADGLLRSVIDLGSMGTSQVTTSRIGSFGPLPGEVATPLAMVVTELVQNAADHAFTGGAVDGHGTVTVAVNRIRDRLKLRISDDGRGLPDDFDRGSSLGLSIVTTLVESELGGTIDFGSTPRGTTVTIALQL